MTEATWSPPPPPSPFVPEGSSNYVTLWQQIWRWVRRIGPDTDA